MKCLISVVFFFLFLNGCEYRSFNQNNKQVDVNKFISSLSEDERMLLEYFFRSLIQHDTVGYVLLGGKPMSFFSYMKPKPVLPPSDNILDRIDLFFEGFDSDFALFERSFEVWKKYAPFFCGQNIFFDSFEQDDQLHYKKVSVINKRQILPLLETNFQSFKEIDSSLEKKALFE